MEGNGRVTDENGDGDREMTTVDLSSSPPRAAPQAQHSSVISRLVVEGNALIHCERGVEREAD